MKIQKTTKTLDVRITYSEMWGCTFKATMLAKDIERHFGISVKPVLRDEGMFEVLVNGTSIYKHQGECKPREGHEAIFSAIRKHKDPVRKAVDAAPAPVKEDDPDYREWMRSVCSGE